MSRYEVVVGNIGTVYDGRSSHEAVLVYEQYVRESQCKGGRASQESIALLRDGDLVMEYIPDSEGGKVMPQ